MECLGEKSSVDFDPYDIVPEIDAEAVDADGFPAVWEMVLGCPTVRGHHGHYDFNDCWLITGSGTQKKMIEDWRAKHEAPADWQGAFGENFLVDLLRKKFRVYTCPNCDSKI